MSDLTDAIEALRKVFDSQQGSYLYTKGYLDESDFELMLATIGPILRGDERVKVASEIADAITAQRRPGITALLEGGWNHACNNAAAIARQHSLQPAEAAASATEPAPVRDSTSGSAEAITAGFGTSKTNTTHEEN